MTKQVVAQATQPHKLTKKARREIVRDIIDRNVIGVPFDGEDLALFNEMIGQTWDAVMRAENPTFPSDPRFIRVCDYISTWEPLSWNKAIDCIDSIPISHERILAKALRFAIRDDIVEYMQSSGEPCSHCGSTEDLTVDHDFPSFSAIVKQFTYDRPPIALAHTLEGAGQTVADMNVEAEWIAFHASHAVYKILCRSCNASKGTKREPWCGA